MPEYNILMQKNTDKPPSYYEQSQAYKNRPDEEKKPVTITETPEQFAMGIKPPPVTFDMIEDLGRVCASIKAMAELGGSKADEQTLRRLARLVLIEREMRQIVHADILFKRSSINDHIDGLTSIFPHYRVFDDCSLIVQDLQAVWDGKKWTGDGACTFNKFHDGDCSGTWDGQETTMHNYSIKTWPKRMLIMHTSMSRYVVGERTVSGRHFIPGVQNFYFIGLKPGDYITGEIYVEIC